MNAYVFPVVAILRQEEDGQVTTGNRSAFICQRKKLDLSKVLKMNFHRADFYTKISCENSNHTETITTGTNVSLAAATKVNSFH